MLKMNQSQVRDLSWHWIRVGINTHRFLSGWLFTLKVHLHTQHPATLHYTVTQFEPGPGINPHHRTKTTYENREGVRPKKKSVIFHNKGWVTLNVKKDKGCNGRRLLPDKKNEINVMIMTHQQTTDELMGLLWYWSPRCLSSLEYKISSAMLSKM